jgi:phosphopantothenoylcysteine decarboxylase/phosphopantothenate--cysteine ligase
MKNNINTFEKILTHSEQKEFSLKSKDEVAKDILDFVETQLKK